MLPFQWNALRTGDRVLVHDDHAAHLDPLAGLVMIVEARRTGGNDVAIRVEPSGRVVRPRRHAVHLPSFGGDPACWRCDMAAGPVGVGVTARGVEPIGVGPGGPSPHGLHTP